MLQVINIVVKMHPLLLYSGPGNIILAHAKGIVLYQHDVFIIRKIGAKVNL